MVKIYKQPFAHDGDKIAIPDTSQPDGKMSNVDGWTPDYQLPKTDPNYKPVGRQEMNGVFKEVTEALGQVQVQGAASWSADGAPYPVSAQVYHNGKQWLARRANSVEPAEGEDWSEPIHSASLLQTTGNSTASPMSQKATTDALSTRVGLTGNQTVAGTKTFSSFPVTPSAAPTANYQTANKKYVDDNAFGVNQSNLYKSDRKLGVTYTNTKDVPIMVSVTCDLSPKQGISLSIQGMSVSYVSNVAVDGSTNFSGQGLVGVGETYIANSDGLLVNWVEFTR